jgi:hypothetical protein
VENFCKAPYETHTTKVKVLTRVFELEERVRVLGILLRAKSEVSITGFVD